MGQGIVTVERHMGQRLREQREAHGLTPEDLAERLGISTAQVHLFEQGAKRIPPRYLIQAAETFRVSIGWFFEDIPQSNCAPPISGINAEMVRFLAMPESFALVSAFVAISSRDRRLTVVDYAKMAGKAAHQS